MLLKTKSYKHCQTLFQSKYRHSTSSQFPILSCELPTEKLQLNRELGGGKIIEEFKTTLNAITSPTLSTDSKIHMKERRKLPVRMRIQKLLDPQSSFFELSQLAGFELYKGDSVPCGGVITGIGLINEIHCMIIANDWTVKAGSLFPITVKKQLRAQKIAMENKLPCIYLVDSGGVNLTTQSESFPDENNAGTIFHNQANMSAEGIPQIAIVLGFCVGVGAYVPALCDETVIVKESGAIFLGGPPLVKAATGEIVTTQELGGAEVHSKISGVTDHLANTEEDAFQMGRNIVASLNLKKSKSFHMRSWEEPIADQSDLNYVYNPESKEQFDPRIIISRVVDGSRYLKKDHCNANSSQIF